MPFRKLFGERGNLAFLLVMFVLVMGFACTLGAATMTMSAGDPRVNEFLKLVGICALVLGNIAVLITNAMNGAGIRKTRHDLKGDIQAQGQRVEVIATEARVTAEEAKTKAHEVAETAAMVHPAVVKEVAEQVRIAEREQVMNDPRCIEAIRKAIEETADLSTRKAEERMRRIIEEMRRGQ